MKKGGSEEPPMICLLKETQMTTMFVAMKTIDHDPNERRKFPSADAIITFVSYLIAAAIFLPIGSYLKAHYAEQIGHFVLSLGGLLY
jgi:hypothetical protein